MISIFFTMYIVQCLEMKHIPIPIPIIIGTWYQNHAYTKAMN